MEAGETLSSIAASLWGDAGLWYKLAEANGMSSDTALVEGQTLMVPAGVMKSTHNALTFKPYDPLEALGETSPTTPLRAKPPKAQQGNKCGVFGQVLLVAVAVAVTALTAGAFIAAAGPVLGGALAGAAGSVVSQGVGLATGIQDKFSFKGVALAAIGGAVGGGVGQALGRGAMAGSQFLGDVVRGAAGSALTQGIGVATGLQKKFDWAGVAAAGIGAGVGNAVARQAFNVKNGAFARTAAGYAQQAASGMAGAIANAATRSLVNGTSFGDNLVAALPDVIGHTVGMAVADGVQGRWARGGSAARGGTETSGSAQAGVGTGNGVAAQPVAGERGGQVGHVGSGDEIVVTGRRWTSADEARWQAQQVVGGAVQGGGNWGNGDASAPGGSGALRDPASGVTMLSGVAGIPALQAGADPYFHAYRDFGGLDTFGEWLVKNRYVGGAELNAAYASDLIAGSNVDQLSRFVLPVLDRFAGGNADILQVRNVLRSHVNAVTAMADRAAWDVTSAGLGTDFLTAGYRLTVNREVTLTNGITVGAAALGPLGGIAGRVISRTTMTAAETALPAVGGHLPNAGGVIRQFTQQGDQVYYRVFSGDSTVGSFLTAVPPRSSAYAREALALPPGNQATFIQEVLVPNGTPVLRSRALPQPDWGRTRGGAEQFQLLEHIPTSNFGPGRPLP